VELLVKPAGREELELFKRNEAYLVRFANTSSLVIDPGIAPPAKAVTAVVTGAELYLPLAGLIDIDQEIARLEKELAHLNAEVERVEKKLANEAFVAKAPPHIVEEERAKERDYREKRDKVLARIAELRG